MIKDKIDVHKEMTYGQLCAVIFIPSALMFGRCKYVFMGLLGCTHVISNKLARANGISFTSMDIDIKVTMDSHGTRLINPIDVPFPEVTLFIKADYEGPRDGALQVVEKLRQHCAVSMMLQKSGTKVVENWTLNGEVIQSA